MNYPLITIFFVRNFANLVLFRFFPPDVEQLGGSEKIGMLAFAKEFPQANSFLLDDLAQRGVESEINLENSATRYWAASIAINKYRHDRDTTLARFHLEPMTNLINPRFMSQNMGYLPNDWVIISRRYKSATA